MASFNMLSPKIRAYKFLSVPAISLKMAKTATGSVAEIKDPKAKQSKIGIS